MKGQPSQEGTAAVKIVVDGETIEVSGRGHLLNALLNAGKGVDTACGGKGTCHLCRVVIAQGADSVPPPTRIEKRALGNVLLAKGFRLSCQVPLVDQLCVELLPYESPSERRQRLLQARGAKSK